MPMTLLYRRLFIRLARNRFWFKRSRVLPETHGAAHVSLRDLLALFVHHPNDKIFGFRVYLFGTGVFELEHILGNLQDGELHTIADAKVWNTLLARILYNIKLARNTGGTKPTWHQNTIVLTQLT